jgi:putative ABC transport system permease protein
LQRHATFQIISSVGYYVQAMIGRLWRTSARIAWRDLRNSGIRPYFIAGVLAAGIASVSGVHAAAAAARKGLEADSRAWLAGDLCVDTGDPITSEQIHELDNLRVGGTLWTLRSNLMATASSSESADPAFIQVKGVDPLQYPFYGTIGLSPHQTLSRAIASHDGVDQAAVSQEVLDRFALRFGDTLSIAGRAFRISALITSEPDRFARELGFGLRAIISREAFERDGFELPPYPVKHRVLLRLGPHSNIYAARNLLQQIFP